MLPEHLLLEIARCLRRREPSLSQARILPGRPPRIRQRPRADAPDGAPQGNTEATGRQARPGLTGTDGRSELRPAAASHWPRRTTRAHGTRPAHSALRKSFAAALHLALAGARLVQARKPAPARFTAGWIASPTRSPCAAAAQAVWPPTRLLRPAPPQPPPHPPRCVKHPTAFCVDSDDAWRLRAGRSAAPLAHRRPRARCRGTHLEQSGAQRCKHDARDGSRAHSQEGVNRWAERCHLAERGPAQRYWACWPCW